MVVTASFGIEPGRRVEYIPLLEEALRLGQHKPDNVLIYNRPNMVIGILNLVLAYGDVLRIIIVLPM